MDGSGWLAQEIWNNYRQHRDLALLRQDIQTSPWYVTPASTKGSLMEIAVQCRDAAAVELLSSLGESVNLPPFAGSSLLHDAVDSLTEAANLDEQREAANVLKTLLRLGADPNIQGMDGTPLHRAAGMGCLDAVRILVRHGADLNARTLVDGELTLVEYARMMNQSRIVDYLIHDAPKEAYRAEQQAEDRGGQ